MTRPKFLHNKCERLIKLLRIQVTVAVGGSTSYWIMCLVFHRTEWLYCIKRMFLSTPNYLFLWPNNKQTEGVCVRTWQVCHTLAVVTVQSYVDSDLRGGKKRTKWSEEEWKELREVVGLPTETAFIHVKPTDSWFLWRQHNTVIKQGCWPQKSKWLNGDYESNMEESKKKSVDRDLRRLPYCVPHTHGPEYVWFCMYNTVIRETGEVSETAETKVDIQSISE